MKKATSVVYILDRSGSMSGLAKDAIGGFNSYIEEQKKAGGDVRVTTVIFDNEYEILYTDKPIAEVPELTSAVYYARGSTALYDALGRSIDTLGARLAEMAEEERPENVIVVVTTDGYENASSEYNSLRIKEMLAHQREKYNWEFMFMCASEDALNAGVDLGFSKNLSAVYSCDVKGMQASSRARSAALCSYAATGSADTLDLQELYDASLTP
jgi:uncharacterized protein YegL